MSGKPSGQLDPQSQWFETVVRRVVQRLSQAKIEARSMNPNEPLLAAEKPVVADAETIRLTESVITLETLRGLRLQNRTVIVGPRTVVTPAVKDELRDRNAKLERQTEATRAVATSPNSLPCFVQGNLARLDPQLMGLGVHLVDANHWGWEQLRQELERRVQSGGQAVWVALEPYVAVCEANRSPSIRAGYGATATAMGKLAQQLKPNVIVLDARRYTHATIREALDQLRRLNTGANSRAGEAS